MISESASTIVVITGLATTAGSSLIALTKMGSKQPTIFASTILIRHTAEITKEMVVVIVES